MMDSVWAETVELPSFPKLEQDMKTDVLIVGGGLAGLLCAYRMARAGADYLLIEADTICSGISRNTTAKLTSQHGLIYGKLVRTFGPEPARIYWEANQTALDQYRQLARQFPCDLETKDAYVYSVQERGPLEEELRALEQIGVPARYEDRLPLPFSTAGAVVFADQAQFHPLKFAAGVAQTLNIREHTAARAFEENRVITDHGTIRASNIIITTHFPMINKHGSYFLKLYQHRSHVLALEQGPELDGMYVDESETGFSFRNYGDLLLLGGGAHRTGKPGGCWEELESFARRYYPKAREKYRWAAQDCMTLDDIPYIGRYSERTSNLYVATGFNKWGMTSSMVAAMILSDLLQGKENPWTAVFSPSRSVLRPQLFANGFEAVRNLLTPTKPRCPHMGCALKWNAQEHTWDCPCHGSRFTKQGELLDNPSTGDLKLKRIHSIGKR